jgi:hypothetical protein
VTEFKITPAQMPVSFTMHASCEECGVESPLVYMTRNDHGVYGGKPPKEWATEYRCGRNLLLCPACKTGGVK